MSQPAIRVGGLSKQYLVGSREAAHGTLYDLLASRLRAPLRRWGRPTLAPAERSAFWALQGVNFEVQPGEVVGVVGRNGAGKSTLLKILSRITAPTEGRIEVRGRLASLLEVGTGFHPELSGRENIYLNGAILGMAREEITRKFDEIVEFAELGRFVDTPVKRYSSGMYVRLAFAVAAHLETDVLLVDEVLAVGDAAFQRKSMGKMNDVAKRGRTVLLVSHNLSAVRNLCPRTLYFEHGGLRFDGPTHEALTLYETHFNESGDRLAASVFTGVLADQIAFKQVISMQEDRPVNVLDPLREFYLEVRGVAERDFASLDLNILIYRDGVHITSCFDSPEGRGMTKGNFVSRFCIPGGTLRPGRYTVSVGAMSAVGSWIWGADVASLEFSENLGSRAIHASGIVGVPYKAERLQ